jgi:digeranylgeranylglycerophospholipid reductase
LHDVIVVGAGPSGNMAALRLSQMGYSVAVLDWRQNIGDKLCTGIIGRECVERFPPDSSIIQHSARSAVLVSPSGKRYPVAKEDAQAYVVDRVAYVNSIAEQAMEAGASYVLGVRVSHLNVSRDGITVATSGENQSQTYQGEMLVLASGFGSPLLRMAGLSNGKSPEYMIGCQAEVAATDLEATEVYLGDAVAAKSFAWLVPLSGSRALAGMAPRRRENSQMDEFLSNVQKSGRVKEVIKKPQTWGIPIKPLSRTYSNRVLAVGDAAGLVKPTTGGGIYYAFISGEIAAKSINEAFRAGDFSAKQLKSYETRWKDVFGKELRIGYYTRMLYESLSDQQIELLMDEFLSDEVLNEVINARDFSFDWHGKVIVRVLRHTNVRRLVMSLGPAAAPFATRLLRARV